MAEMSERDAENSENAWFFHDRFLSFFDGMLHFSFWFLGSNGTISV